MSDPTIRDATPADIPAILGLVRELAIFEKAEHEVVATEDDFRRDGFGATPRFHCRVLEAEGCVCGFSLWFFNYSTWLGRPGVYLEDLFVTEARRGQGLGTQLLLDLAAIAVERGAGRLDLNVLHWNPARRFYEKLGLTQMDEWLPYRIAGDALLALGSRRGS